MRDSTVSGRLVLATFFSGFSHGLLWAVLAPYLRGLGVSASLYGGLRGLSAATAILATLLAGLLSDRLGARRTMSLGLLLYPVGMALLSQGSLTAVTLGFVFTGAGMGLSSTAMTVLASRSVRDEALDYSFSYSWGSSVVGGALGSFSGWVPWILGAMGWEITSGYRLVIASGALASLIASPIALGVPERPPPSSRHIPRLRGLGVLRPAIASSILIGFGAALAIHNIDYYFTAKYGLTSRELGSIFGLQQLLLGASMFALPRLSRRVGGALNLYTVLTLSSVPLLVAMTLTGSYLTASAIYLARSVLMNLSNPLFQAFAMRLVPSEMRGTAASLLRISWEAPLPPGRALGGYLLELDLELPLRITAALYTVAITGMWAAYRRVLRVERRSL